MKAKKSILTPKQKIFLKEFINNSPLSSLFYLTGGTALSEFYLQHRLSEDLDFFCPQKFEIDIVHEFINKEKTILQAEKVLFEKRNGRDIFTLDFKNKDFLKVEFVHYPYHNLAPFKKIGNLSVDSLIDIAVNKLFSVFARNETKDFVDLFFLLKKYTVTQLLDGVEKKFELKLSKFSVGNEFYKIRKITQLPKMIRKLSLRELIDYFKDQARELGGIILT